jgi:hypothetical protein
MEKLSPVLSLLFVRDWEEQIKMSQAILKFGGLGHTCVIFSKEDARIREYALRMPAFRVLVNTPSPQGSTGITTGILPSMTLGCGAMAGNITSDNVGPMRLVNVKRLAYPVRTAEEAFTPAEQAQAGPVAKSAVSAAVEKYLAQRGMPMPPPATIVLASPAAQVVDKFLQSRGVPEAPPAPSCGCGTGVCETKPSQSPAPSAEPPAPPIQIVDFVCEADVRSAIQQSRKIYIGPRTIVTPSARELAGQHDTIVVAQR